MPPTSSLLRLGTALAMGALVLAGIATSAPAAANTDLEKHGLSRKQLLNLRDISHLPIPDLKGFSPAKPVSGFSAPEGDHWHTQAYKSAQGCVAFFLPPERDQSSIGFKVKNLKCNGQPLEGKGELQIIRKDKEGGRLTTVVGILRGQFSKGMLTGEGEKINLSFSSEGKLQGEIYIFGGEFKNSVLHGIGRRYWIELKAERPQAVYTHAKFEEGVPYDRVYMGALHPAPGVESVSHFLAMNKKGELFIDQAGYNQGRPVRGQMFLENDPHAWQTQLTTLQNGVIRAGSLRREAESAEIGRLDAICENFDFKPGKITCPAGSVATAWRGTTFLIKESAYAILSPSKGPGFVAENPGEKIYAGSPSNFAGEYSKTQCNHDLSLCQGRIITPIERTNAYFYGATEIQDGFIKILSASLHEKTSPDPEGNHPGKDRTLATCSKFDSATRCASGMIYRANGIALQGAWELKNIEHHQASASMAHVYFAEKTWSIEPKGFVEMELPDGRRARVEFENGVYKSVSSCSAPDEQDVRCTVKDGGLQYHYRRESSYEPPPKQPQWAMPQTQTRHKNIVVPKRQVYVLPGMP